MIDRRTCSAWMFGFVAGSLTGAGIALLMAPQSGRATRGSMKRTLGETTASARDLKNRTIRRGEGLRDEAARLVRSAAAAVAGEGA